MSVQTAIPHPADEATHLALGYASAIAARYSDRLRLEHLVYAAAHYGGEAAERWLRAKGLTPPDVDAAIARAAKKYGRDAAPAEWAHVEPLLDWRGSFPPLSPHAAAALTPSLTSELTIDRLLDDACRVTSCHVIEELERRPPQPKADIKLSMVNDDAIVREIDDRLHLGTYADAIAGLIDDPKTGTPLTIAISAPWGAGKTSLARMIKRRLEEKPAAGGYSPHVTCWFNAWMHDGAKDLAAAFAAAVARQADECRPLWRQRLTPLPASMLPPNARSRRAFGIIGGLLTIAVLVAMHFHPELASLLPREQQEAVKAVLTPAQGVPLAGALMLFLTLLPHVNTTANALAGFIKSPESSAGNAAISDVRTQLRDLIRQATPKGSRFVVFIDDLERCQPPRSIEVLEVVNQLLSESDVVTVLMADMPAVAACADLKYKDYAERYNPDADQQAREKSRITLSYGWLYLQKIVQVRFDVPSYDRMQIAELLNGLSQPHERAPEPEASAEPKGGRWSSVVRLVKDISSAASVRGSLSSATEAASAPVAVAVCLLMAPALALRNVAESLAYPRHRRPRALDVSAGAWNALRWIPAAVSGVFLLALLIVAGGAAQGESVALPTFAGAPWWVPTNGIVLYAIAWGGAIAAAALAAAGLALYRRFDDRKRILEERISTDPGRIAPAIRQERLYQERAAEPTLLVPARDEALKHIPPLPRATKRLFNELRLLLYILSTRDLFADGNLKPEHVGKWLAMRERWPDLARLVAVRPSLLAAIEKDMSQLRLVSPALADDLELATFVRQHPTLGDVVDRLVRFRIDAKPASA